MVREGASTQNLNHRKYSYFLPASKQAFPRRVAEVESELSESEKEHEREREVVMGGGGGGGGGESYDSCDSLPADNYQGVNLSMLFSVFFLSLFFLPPFLFAEHINVGFYSKQHASVLYSISFRKYFHVQALYGCSIKAYAIYNRQLFAWNLSNSEFRHVFLHFTPLCLYATDG